MFGYGRGGRDGRAGSVDGEVLAELRAIRQELQHMSERVANAATREELDAYVTRDAFDAHVLQGQRLADLWQRWVPTGLSAFAIGWAIFGPHIHFG